MSETTHPRGLTYRGDEGDNGKLSVYEFWLRGRSVLEVVVDNTDSDLAIWIGKPGELETGELIKTRGVAQRVEAFEGGPEIISSTTIRMYVEPRLAVLIARVFVPGDKYAQTDAG